MWLLPESKNQQERIIEAGDCCFSFKSIIPILKICEIIYFLDKKTKLYIQKSHVLNEE